MNKTAIKNFAVWARRKLIADITYKAGLIGITESGIAEALPQSTSDLQFFDIGTKDYAKVAGKEITQRDALVRAIHDKENNSDYETAFKAIIEEVAYTWFNRLIAIRFMEVNDYLPSRVRVLSSENPAKIEPDFVTTPFDTDMEFTIVEQDKIMQLKNENKLDELFRILFIKQCNKLHEILPELFEETNNYTELLLSISFTDKDGIIYHLTHDINEKDFNVEKEGQVEIIGWMYQFYNIEPKAAVFAKKGKITKHEIPAATQLFTPDWIVRYMVENSLGRLWIEGHPEVGLKNSWKYYLDETTQEANVQNCLEKIYEEYRNLNPEDIKIIDPCMGSGHILVYSFDVLMQIYETQGYTQRDAVRSIIENNIYGLDIDKRATQLAYFALMMKARQYDRRFLTRKDSDGNADIPQANVFCIEDSTDINTHHLKFFGCSFNNNDKLTASKMLNKLLDELKDAKGCGSILKTSSYDYEMLYRYTKDVDISGQMTLETLGIDVTQEKVEKLITISKMLSAQYEIVITNPPYMGVSNLEPAVQNYVKDNYPDSKTDLFAVFIEKCCALTRKNGMQAMITQHAWMFLQSFEKLRKKIIRLDTINMAHLGPRAFEEIGGEVVQTTSFVIRKNYIENYKGSYSNLIEPTSQQGKEDLFLKRTNIYKAKSKEFLRISGSPFAYWATNEAIDAFDNGKLLSDIANPRQGLITGDVGRFVRKWYECSSENLNLHSPKNISVRVGKWFPYCNGGTYRKWFGNNEDVVNWEDDGFEVKNFRDENGKQRSRPQNMQYYFQEGGTWSAISSSSLSVRYFPEGHLFSNAGMAIYASHDELLYITGLLNSKLSQLYLGFFNGGLNYNQGDIARLPVLKKDMETVVALVQELIDISKQEWDEYELSWDFQKHPLVRGDLIAEAYTAWENRCAARFEEVKEKETLLNQLLIGVYGLEGEISPFVDDSEVTIRKADLGRDIRSLISYAVGCMFGRYSLSSPGVVYAGGEWNDDVYNGFIPDKDNCIPITDEAYFEDDIVGLVIGWMKKVFGKENLEANLDFIAKVLGNKGSTSREVIRNYFLKDFMKDHIKIYQKRPIYWLFDSGKQDGFKALVYMHRWNADTVGNMRVEYLHKMQHTYEREIIRMQETIDNSRDSREVSKATKRKDKLQKQLKETKEYDAKLAHIALSRIDIELDDGVRVNYEKIQTGKDGKKMQIMAKI